MPILGFGAEGGFRVLGEASVTGSSKGSATAFIQGLYKSSYDLLVQYPANLKVNLGEYIGILLPQNAN